MNNHEKEDFNENQGNDKESIQDNNTDFTTEMEEEFRREISFDKEEEY